MKAVIAVLLLTSGLQQALAGCLPPNQYTGKVSVTTSGRQCQAWSSQSPQAHTVGSANSQFPDGSVTAAANYCRDPDNTGYPWCYTTNPGIRWEGCRVDLCADTTVNVCASNPCPSGTTCSQYSNAEFVCFCNGYTGNKCPQGSCTAPNSYTGRMNVTVSGRACQAWSSQSPQGHSIGSSNGDFAGDGSLANAKNYCRDPNNSGFPWCYTTDPSRRWEYCNIDVCKECTLPSKYKDTKSMTVSGRKCQNWSVQFPHSHTAGTLDSQFPDGSVTAAANYCRDPDNTGYPWCYTTDPATRWEACGINLCAKTCPNPRQYTGKVSVTANGRQCQFWSAQSPQAHSVGSLNSQFPDGSVAAAANYCRDPDNTGYPWCYTTNPGIRWEACVVDLCAPVTDLCAANPCPKGQVCAMNSATSYLCYCAGYTGSKCPTNGCTTPAAYPGKVATTMSGRTCQAWSAQSPHTHSVGSADSNFPYDASVKGASNYCRDPNNSGFLWCYTMDPAMRWEACNADLCACVLPSKYMGKVSVTASGKTCQAWTAQSPHSHSAGTSNTQFPDGSVAAAANYCRDPDNTGFPWCYTTDPLTRWERCNVNLCGSDDPCVSSPCKNSGVCKSSGSTFTCQCAVGYSGASCETIVPDPCDASPCANGGVCARNGNTDFVCTCAGGFTGPKCQSATGPCASSPCQNGGICSNIGTTDYNCDCPDDYNDGDTCSQYQNPCDTSPCRNGGSCTRLSAIAYSCSCPPSYVGQFCELKANTKPCDNSPCLNGGTCTNTGDTTYTCQCSKLWEGPACNIVHCLNDEKACSTLTYYGRFAKCDDCTKSVACRAKKQRVKQCNAASVPYYDRSVKKCTTSNAVCAGL